MKKLILSLLASTLFAPAALCAAAFEGKVSFKLTSPRGQAQEMHYQIKGEKLRIELPGQQGMGGMIVDAAKKESLVIIDPQRMYMVMPMPDVAPASKGEKSGDAPTLEKTGEKEKILGYDAEKYVSKHEDTTTELWLAEGLGPFMGLNQGGPMMGGKRGRGPIPPGWERALAGKELFPLRVVGKDKGNKETFRMEVTAIEKQSLPDSLFAPPADYQKMDMGGMM